MISWEYRTFLLSAEKTKQTPEQLKKLPSYDPQLLEPYLNQLGAEGWELVSLTPHLIGDNHDIGFGIAGAAGTRWTHIYLCVAKRPK